MLKKAKKKHQGRAPNYPIRDMEIGDEIMISWGTISKVKRAQAVHQLLSKAKKRGMKFKTEKILDGIMILRVG
jgi:hypothetical protein